MLWVLHLETAEPSPPPVSMTDNNKSTKKYRFQSVLHLPKGTPRPCREFMARTTLVVQRATSSVCRLKCVDIDVFSPTRIRTCSDLLKQVKLYLSMELGSTEETQMAFQSIKKLLPDSCKCLKYGLLDDLRTRLSRPPPSLPTGYLNFARKIARETFSPGWDYRWDHKVNTFSPSLGSCIGKSRKNGGQLASLAVDGQESWQESLNRPLPGTLEGELLLVNSAGKPRPLTRFSDEAAHLRPLHGLLYDRLSTFDWLNRGDVSAENLRRAGFDLSVRGEKPLTSGDYKSASDNLSIEVAEAILDVAWSTCKKVPASVFRYAMAAQRPNLAYEDKEGLRESFVPTRGQMMGSYLCFPLLCLQNYIAFRYAEMCSGLEGTPVLINGDDILFQSSAQFSRDWMSVVSRLGLEVEQTKTSVSTEYGSLNSTLLRWTPEGLAVVKTLRFGMLREVSHPGTLGISALLFSRVGPRDTWLRNFEEFLSWHQHTIYKWRCVASDMGFSGRLALRAWTRFRGGRLLWRDDVLHRKGIDKLPAAHCPHNVIMGSREFVSVDPTEVTNTMSVATAMWMASRKWELGSTFKVCVGGRMVSERANATQLPSHLQQYRYSAKLLKRESDLLMVRTEYYWHCGPESQVTRPHVIKTLGTHLKDRMSRSGSRVVKMTRSWWSSRCEVKMARIPRDIWEVKHPPLDPFRMRAGIVEDMRSGQGEVFCPPQALFQLAGLGSFEGIF